MAKDDPLDHAPAGTFRFVDGQDGCGQRVREIYLPVSPGLVRYQGESLVITAYGDGTVAAFIQEDWEDVDHWGV